MMRRAPLMTLLPQSHTECARRFGDGTVLVREVGSDAQDGCLLLRRRRTGGSWIDERSVVARHVERHVHLGDDDRRGRGHHVGPNGGRCRRGPHTVFVRYCNLARRRWSDSSERTEPARRPVPRHGAIWLWRTVACARAIAQTVRQRGEPRPARVSVHRAAMPSVAEFTGLWSITRRSRSALRSPRPS